MEIRIETEEAELILADYLQQKGFKLVPDADGGQLVKYTEDEGVNEGYFFFKATTELP